MAVLKVKKARIITHSSKEEKVLQLLQSLELAEFVKKEEETELGQELSNVKKVVDIESAIKILRQYIKKEPSLWLTRKEVNETAQNYDWESVVKKVHDLQQEIPFSENQINSLMVEYDQLLPWKKLPISTANLEGSSTTEITLFQTNEKSLEELEEQLKEAKLSFSINKLPSNKPAIPAYLISEKNHANKVKGILSTVGITAETLSVEAVTVAEAVKSIEKEIHSHREKIAEVKSKLEELAVELQSLKITHDYYSANLARETTSAEGEKTERTSVFTAWVPFDSLESLEKSLHKISPATAIVEIEPEEGETPPVELRNNKVFSMFESVTRVYGLPKHDEIDPTSALAPFFFVFFGVCLTDVGYGIIMFLMMTVALLFVKLDPGMKKLVRLLQWGGISAIIFGWLFGGFFAMQATEAPAFLLTAEAKAAIAAGTEIPETPFIGQLINPIGGNGLLMFLGLAFAVGLIHLIFGVAVDGYWKIKQKNFRAAFEDSFLWICLLSFGVAWAGAKMIPLSNSLVDFTLIGTLAAVGGIILFQGRVFDHLLAFFKNLFTFKIGKAIVSLLKAVAAVPMGLLKLYNLIGFLSDTLSYSRLMALGLATGIIGFAMNTIAAVMSDMIPGIGIVVAIFVLVFGHLVNLALSGLGAFIHSGRLQFVEFFGKFMEGGGRAWKPMDGNFKYVSLLEEGDS